MKLPRKLKKEIKKGFDKSTKTLAMFPTIDGVFAGFETGYTTKAKRKTKAFNRLVLLDKRDQKRAFKFFAEQTCKAIAEDIKRELQDHHKMNHLLDSTFAYSAKTQLTQYTNEKTL